MHNRTAIFALELPPRGRTCASARRLRARLVRAALAALVGAALPACAGAGQPGPAAAGTDPANATYRIEGEPVALRDGAAAVPAAPGSAAQRRTTVSGKPAYGDLDGDGDDDAAVFLVHDPGGSGTFVYLAAALREARGYRGTQALLLGDRVAPRELRIRNGVVTASYTGRRPGEPLAAPPSVEESAHFTLEGDELRALGPLPPGETLLGGWVTLGHEVREFRPCDGEAPLWLRGDSPALGEILAAHRAALPGAPPYATLFMTLVGSEVAQPGEGFGAGYAGSFRAARLVRTAPRGNCRSEWVQVDAPAAGAAVRSPLQVRGRARGGWFFEGDFPLLLKDAAGNVIARKYCKALGEWMTDGFVDFEGTLDFEAAGSAGPGWLVLRKDNPSEQRELDDSVEIPVFLH